MHGFRNQYFDEGETIAYRVIVLVYFSFTSLTTVGFGDFTPRSDVERVFIVVMIFVGIAVFSYTIGNFVEVLEKFNLIKNEFDEG